MMGRASLSAIVSNATSNMVLARSASGLVLMAQLITRPQIAVDGRGQIDFARADVALGNVGQPFLLRRLNLEVVVGDVLRRGNVAASPIFAAISHALFPRSASRCQSTCKKYPNGML